MKTEKDLPYVLEDEFRGPNDLGICQEFGEEFNANSFYERFTSSTNEKLTIIITGNYLIENVDEEYFLVINGINECEYTKIARIKYTKPEYVHLPKEFDCGKEELILTNEEKQLLNDIFKREFDGKPLWKQFLWRTIKDLEGFTKTYITEDIEQPNYLELPD